MIRIWWYFAVAFLVFCAPILTLAQVPAPLAPPRILLIVREIVKPGKEAEHEKQSSAYAQILTRNKSQHYKLALTSISGDKYERVYVLAFESFVDIEVFHHDLERMATVRLNTAVDQVDRLGGDLHTAQHAIIAVYRGDLSYRPSMNMARARYLRVATFRLRPGYGENFREWANIEIAGHEKANVEEHWAAYEVTYGAPNGTYLLLSPLRSMEELDAMPETHKHLGEALGEENRRRLQQIERESFLLNESNIYEFNPKMSYVSQAVASADPDFWTPKQKVTSRPALSTKKKTKQPSAKP